MGLVLSGENLIKIVEFTIGLGLQNLQKAMCGAHVEVQESRCLASNLQLGQLVSDPRETLTVGILSVAHLLFTHTIYTLITYKIVWRLSDRKPLKLRY